ncbi:hypothetical protein C4588_03975 [Candidatus Parcubacteria bacterium]|nr:MAG: hypothetical protein C4588_03975 [Candidatus Parcubacteria bacterium]
MSLTELFMVIEKGGSGSGNFGHGGRPGKIGGSSGGVALGKQKVESRAKVLGYKKITYEETKKGLQVIAEGPKGTKPKKLNLYITEDGNLVNKEGKPALGWG